MIVDGNVCAFLCMHAMPKWREGGRKREREREREGGKERGRFNEERALPIFTCFTVV